MTLPDDWLIKPLAEVAQIIMGQSPDSKYYSEEEVGLPFLQGCAEFQGRHPKHVIYCSHRKKIGCTGSILLSVRAPVGRMNIANHDYVIGRGLAALNGTRVTQNFLEHFLVFQEPKFRLASQGSTFEAINSSELKQWPILHPKDKAEQAKIAEVLSTVDRAIEQTEALIAKQQRIKTGLMQDLLTRGIDEHGNLRSEQTHECKDSSLGRIPAGWEVKALSEIGWFTNGINKSKEDFGFGTLFVNIADVYPDHLDVHSLGRLNASDAEATRYGLNIGDILIDRSSVKLEGVGYPTVFEGHNEPVVFCGFIIRFRPRVNINSRFLCLQMRDDPFRIEVFKVATRSANVNVNQESLAELRIKIPTVDEQNRIVSFEAAIDKEHQNLRTQLVKLASLKTALMQDLLTGNKRVNALVKQAAKD